jgi:hypothetical protein
VKNKTSEIKNTSRIQNQTSSMQKERESIISGTETKRNKKETILSVPEYIKNKAKAINNEMEIIQSESLLIIFGKDLVVSKREPINKETEGKVSGTKSERKKRKLIGKETE